MGTDGRPPTTRLAHANGQRQSGRRSRRAAKTTQPVTEQTPAATLAEALPVEPVRNLFRAFGEFAHLQAVGGVLLLCAAVAALVWANSPWADTYAALWSAELTVGVDQFALSMTLLHWINDGLM